MAVMDGVLLWWDSGAHQVLVGSEHLGVQILLLKLSLFVLSAQLGSFDDRWVFIHSNWA